MNIEPQYSSDTADKLFQNLPLVEKRMLLALSNELHRAMNKHPKWPQDDIIHAAAIVNEESGELIRAALQKTYDGGNVNDCMIEAVHTGATALRFLLNA